MTSQQDSSESDRLLKNLLNQVELRDSEMEEHPDEQTLALFAENRLSIPSRDQIVQHLSECSICRQSVSNVLRFGEDVEEISPMPSTQRVAPYATPAILLVAASLLVAVGMWILGPRPEKWTEAEVFAQASALLKDGQFHRVSALISDANRAGVQSARLLVVKAQSIQQIASLASLDARGTLPDFGFGIGGIVARDPMPSVERAQIERAQEVLKSVRDTETLTALNQGHVCLALQDVAEARRIFEEITQSDPQGHLGWLGLGLSMYLTGDFAGAEAAFRESSRLAPHDSAPQINLAMTLEERGNIDAAATLWREILEEFPSERFRPEIEQHLLEISPTSPRRPVP